MRCRGIPLLARDALACLTDVAVVLLAMAVVALWGQAGGADTAGGHPGGALMWRGLTLCFQLVVTAADVEAEGDAHAGAGGEAPRGL